MKKLIEISGEFNEKGTTANKLSVMAAMAGKNLKLYIKDLLDNHVKK